MNIISQNTPNVNGIGGLGPGEEDRATVETDLSALPAPSGRGSPSERGLGTPLNCRTFITPKTPQAPLNLGGVNALNSQEGVVSYQAASNGSLDSVSGIPSRFGGLVGFKPVNSNFSRSVNSIAIENIVKAFRGHCSKLEGSPYVYIVLRHKEDASLALYRTDSCSWSRYFPQGRYNIRKDIYQRLEASDREGVFFHLTVDTKRLDLVHSWPSMWPQFNRFKTSLNKYRRNHMNATGGIRYLAATEPHESHFPHLHVYCPGLRWLIKREDLHKMDKWWGLGSVKTEKELKHDTARDYILKYISKLDGWDEVSMAMLWHFKMRIYNLSHRYYLAKRESEWKTLGRYTDAEGLAEGLAEVGVRFGVKSVEGLVESMDDIGAGLIYLTTP